MFFSRHKLNVQDSYLEYALLTASLINSRAQALREARLLVLQRVQVTQAELDALEQQVSSEQIKQLTEELARLEHLRDIQFPCLVRRLLNDKKKLMRDASESESCVRKGLYDLSDPFHPTFNPMSPWYLSEKDLGASFFTSPVYLDVQKYKAKFYEKTMSYHTNIDSLIRMQILLLTLRRVCLILVAFALVAATFTTLALLGLVVPPFVVSLCSFITTFGVLHNSTKHDNKKIHEYQKNLARQQVVELDSKLFSDLDELAEDINLGAQEQEEASRMQCVA